MTAVEDDSGKLASRGARAKEKAREQLEEVRGDLGVDLTLL
jgi:hypothetical protein